MIEKKNVILPIWHRVSAEEVASFSLPLADKKAGSTQDGINSLLRDLIKKIKPEQSPLIVAKEYLEKLNVDTPIISDEWWLDIVEYKEFLKFPDLNANKRWIFPLPYSGNDYGKERGLNIASTVLQLDWSFEGEELNISPITRPEIVHEYIRRWPGLYNCAREHPEILALYTPQLTIRGFDDGFEDVFDELLNIQDNRSDIIFSFGGLETIFDQKPTCGNIIALRHPTFGNYTNRTLARTYFHAHDTSYSRSNIDAFEGLVWLLSEDSNWLPEKLHNSLIDGTLNNDIWLQVLLRNDSSLLFNTLIKKSKRNFNYTKTIKDELKQQIVKAINDIQIIGNEDVILDKMLTINIAQKYYEYQNWLEEFRSKINSSR